MARADKWMEPYGNAINPITKAPIYGDPVSAIGAGASIVGGLMGSDAASSAADAQAKAANQATASQLQMFNTVNDQNAPYRQAGQTALNALLYGTGLGPKASTTSMPSSAKPLTYAQWAAQNPSLANAQTPISNLYIRDYGVNSMGLFKPTATSTNTQGQAAYNQYLNGFNASNAANTTKTTSGVPGVGYGDLTHQFNANDLATNLSPSYNFMLSQGLGALQNSQAAQGGLVGGNALRGINDYAQNYASTGYQQAYNNYNTNQTNIFNRLAGIAGLGQTANSTSAQTAQAISPGVANTIQGAGQANAAGIVGSTNALTGGMNNALGWYQLNKLNTQNTPNIDMLDTSLVDSGYYNR